VVWCSPFFYGIPRDTKLGVDPAYIESFNSRVRAEFLNAHWFQSLLEARTAAVEWRHAYHTTHAHSALNYMTPEEFLANYEAIQSPQKSLAA